jgi:hypothetical protein
MKQALIFSGGYLSAILVVAASVLIWEGKRITKVHTLTRPMLISSNRADKMVHTLPPGTTLYFERSFPEEFSRYKVYINVDRMPLVLRDLPDPHEIDPLDARLIDKANLDRKAQK